MSKRLNDLGTSVDLKFDTKKIKAQANEILNAEPEERKIFMKHKKAKIALIAAVITMLGFRYSIRRRRSYIVFSVG